jgi:hypothetical protein
MPETIPTVVLGGSDKKPVTLPPDAEGKHALTGCKGVDIRLGGRCLADLTVERLRACGRFDPIWIAGPAEAYATSENADRVIDTDSGFGGNIRAGLEFLRERHPGRPLAMTTCDILPEPEDLELALTDYDSSSPCDLWFAIVEAPDDPQALGASSWKPRYWVAPSLDADPIAVLPGHLAIFDPEAMRRQFVYRLLELAYRTRNRPIGYRRSYLLRRLLMTMILQDLRLLFRLQPPTLTWDITHSGLRAARRLRQHVVTRQELEDALRRIFVKRSHRRRHPERRIEMPILDAVSLALDIDTLEEAAGVGGAPVPIPASNPASS